MRTFFPLLRTGWLLTLLMAGLRCGYAAETFPRPATPEEITTLVTALEQTARELSTRWAFTEKRLIRDEKGRVKTDTLVRYDPSRPYAEHYTPLQVNGKEPTDRDRERFRKQGERAEKRDDDAERGVVDRRRTLGEVIEPRGAKLVSLTDEATVFELPLRADNNDRFPPEKFEVLVRLGRTSRQLENITVRLRGSFRSKLVLKVKSGDATLEFAPVEPRFAPTLRSVRGDASASILFFSVGGDLELTRSDFKRVKPFREKFDVQIGTLKAIDF